MASNAPATETEGQSDPIGDRQGSAPGAGAAIERHDGDGVTCRLPTACSCARRTRRAALRTAVRQVPHTVLRAPGRDSEEGPLNSCSRTATG